MFRGVRIEHPPGDEAEKPFWISYADLMTSLTVLFLVVMLASLVSLNLTVTSLQQTKARASTIVKRYNKLKAGQARRDKDVNRFWERLDRQSRGLGVKIDRNARVINFGSRARFDTGSHTLSGGGELLLRRFTPVLLREADSKLGRKVVSRVVVEGYADRRGSYLYNLNLSLNRSQRVLCALLGGGRGELPAKAKRRVRDLFLVGGFSFNSARRSLAASRRVEVRVDFLPVGGRRERARRGNTSFGDCALDT